jgi:hypothetical protein
MDFFHGSQVYHSMIHKLCGIPLAIYVSKLLHEGGMKRAEKPQVPGNPARTGVPARLGKAIATIKLG